MRELALFAGAGGGLLGSVLLGHRPVCAVELDPYARRVLLARQRDGILPTFPIWDDVRTFDGFPWRGKVELISGGFPCQDISSAGRGAGIEGARSGLWSEFARIVGEVGPRFVLVENSPLLTVRGLGRVLGDLASLGFDADWGVLGADDAGAPHIRKRIWILAHAEGEPSRSGFRGALAPRSRRHQPCDGGSALAHSCGQWGPNDELCPGGNLSGLCREELGVACSSGLEEWEGQEAQRPHAAASGAGWWAAEPRLGRVAHGMARRVDRLRAIGNGQVPAVVRLAWTLLEVGR